MEVLKPNSVRVMVPAGKYVIGDPCYCFPDTPSLGLEKPYWDMLGESCDWWQNTPVATLTVQGREFNVLAFDTAFGDGEYEDNQGFVYSVDAGLIGLVPLELVELIGGEVDPSLHKVVDFKRDTVCTNSDGMMVFGHLAIDTNEWAHPD